MGTRTRWLKWREMNWLRLVEGPADNTILHVAPTMKNIVYKGQSYFRMPNSRTMRRGAPGDRTPMGGLYLWKDWMPTFVVNPDQEPGTATLISASLDSAGEPVVSACRMVNIGVPEDQ